MAGFETPSTLACRRCGHQPSPAEFLDGLKAWWPKVPVLIHLCTQCGEREEVQIEPDLVLFGYVYAAGTAHFCAMERCEIPGLGVGGREQDLLLTLADRQWRLPPPPSAQSPRMSRP